MFEEGWNRGEIEVFSQTLADPLVFHYAGSPREMSLQDTSRIVLRWREAFPDLRMDIEALVAEDDLVRCSFASRTARWSSSGSRTTSSA